MPELEAPKFFTNETLEGRDYYDMKAEYTRKMKMLKNDLLKYDVDPSTDILGRVDRFLKKKNMLILLQN